MSLVHVLWCQYGPHQCHYWSHLSNYLINNVMIVQKTVLFVLPDSFLQTFQTFVSEFLISKLEPMQFFFYYFEDDRNPNGRWFGVTALKNTFDMKPKCPQTMFHWRIQEGSSRRNWNPMWFQFGIQQVVSHMWTLSVDGTSGEKLECFSYITGSTWECYCKKTIKCSSSFGGKSWQ